MNELKTFPSSDKALTNYIYWALESGGKFHANLLENLARYPVGVREFIEGDEYLGLKNVYPAVIESLEQIYNTGGIHLGTEYKEIVLSGGIGSAKSYTSVLGILYGVYLLSCFRNPHAIFGLDPASEIVFIFQSLNFKTGNLAYKLAREFVLGAKYFTSSFPVDSKIKSEIVLPNNIILRPVSGEQTAAIGQNVISCLLDEASFMDYVKRSTKAEEGGEYDQARALYGNLRTRIDSRFAKYGAHLIPMWVAGSARHEEDFVQKKIKAAESDPTIYVYNKRVWEVKPWDYSGETFRVYLGKNSIPPQIVEPEDALYDSENTLDVPVELRSAFNTQGIRQALRDHCGVPSGVTGNFIVEVDKAKSRFDRRNIFTTASCTFLNGDLPKVLKSFRDNPRSDRVWFAHLDMSRTGDNTGIALGYLDKWVNNRPQYVVAGVLEVRPTVGAVIPWDAIVHFLFRLSRIIPLYCISADQVAHNYMREQMTPYGYMVERISDNASSDIFHGFLNTLTEGNVSIANHAKTIKELLALNVDEKTGKVTKPAGGSKDCIDAVVSLVALLKKVPRHLNYPDRWSPPNPPAVELSAGGYEVAGTLPEHGNIRVTVCGGRYAFGEDDGQELGAVLRADW